MGYDHDAYARIEPLPDHSNHDPPTNPQSVGEGTDGGIANASSKDGKASLP